MSNIKNPQSNPLKSYEENRDRWSDGGVPSQRSRAALVPH